MSYRLDVDQPAQAEIDALPHEAAVALAEVFAMLRLVPWNGEPYHDRKPDGPMRTLTFGGYGVVTYLILEDRQRVDVLIVAWAG